MRKWLLKKYEAWMFRNRSPIPLHLYAWLSDSLTIKYGQIKGELHDEETGEEVKDYFVILEWMPVRFLRDRRIQIALAVALSLFASGVAAFGQSTICNLTNETTPLGTDEIATAQCPGVGNERISLTELWAAHELRFDTEAELEAIVAGVNLIIETEIDTEAKLEALIGSLNLILDTEIDTEAEFEALVAGLNFLISTEINTEAKLEALVAGLNFIIDSEIDTSLELLNLLGDETGTGAVVFGTSPAIDKPALTLAQSATPTPTAEGVAEWDTNDDRFAVGDGAATKLFSSDSVAAAHHTATVDTGPSPDCSGTEVYQDGEAGCDTRHAGSNWEADLEEETHAAEHLENAADEITVEALGTACTDGQIVDSDGAGGLDCISAGGDLSGALDAAVVGDDSHAHTSSTLSGIVQSMYWGAGSFLVDGDECEHPGTTTINGGPKTRTLSCPHAASETDGFSYQSVVLPDSFDKTADVTFELSAYLTTDSGAGTWNGVVDIQCQSEGEIIDSTWGTGIGLDLTPVAGDVVNDVIQDTSGAVDTDTTGQDCAGGDVLSWRWKSCDTDATPSAGCASSAGFENDMSLLGMKMEYTTNVGD